MRTSLGSEKLTHDKFIRNLSLILNSDKNIALVNIDFPSHFRPASDFCSLNKPKALEGRRRSKWKLVPEQGIYTQLL